MTVLSDAGSEARQLAAVDRPARDLVGRVPAGLVGQPGHRQTRRRRAAAVSHDPVPAPRIVRSIPRAVVGHELSSHEQIPGADFRRRRAEDAPVAVHAALDPRQRPVNRIEIVDADGAGGGKVACLDRIRALLILDAAHQL
jgi:hypothetical protein